MPNETKQMSAAGLSALRAREGAVLHYYNDIANNCTFGVGGLAHHGPCTDDAMRRPVSVADVNTQLAVSVRSAEVAVRSTAMGVASLGNCSSIRTICAGIARWLLSF